MQQRAEHRDRDRERDQRTLRGPNLERRYEEDDARSRIPRGEDIHRGARAAEVSRSAISERDGSPTRGYRAGGPPSDERGDFAWSVERGRGGSDARPSRIRSDEPGGRASFDDGGGHWEERQRGFAWRPHEEHARNDRTGMPPEGELRSDAQRGWFGRGEPMRGRDRVGREGGHLAPHELYTTRDRYEPERPSEAAPRRHHVAERRVRGELDDRAELGDADDDRLMAGGDGTSRGDYGRFDEDDQDIRSHGGRMKSRHSDNQRYGMGLQGGAGGPRFAADHTPRLERDWIHHAVWGEAERFTRSR